MLEATPQLLTLEDAARSLAVSVRTIERLARDGDIRMVYVGRLRRISRADVDAFINRSAEDAPDAAA